MAEYNALDLAGYDGLAMGIVKHAVRDYKKARRQLHNNPRNEKAQWELCEVKGFFRSDWYKRLCTLDPEWLLAKVDKELEEEFARKKNSRN